MKTIIIILIAVLITAGITAQVPQKMSYQAIIRDSKDALITNQQIGFRISILQGAVNGAEVYMEIFNPNPVTNSNGLITVEIGSGNPTLGTFSSIDWSNGPYFIKTEIDPTGNSDYTIVTISQLLSVPYALHAKTAEVLIGDSVTRSYIDALEARIEAVEKHLNISPDSVFTDSVFTDARDGTKYKTVKIGDQTWMAENLRYLPDVVMVYKDLSNTEPQYYVNYNENYPYSNVNEAKATANYNIYGVLYNWPAAMNGGQESTSNPSGVQGVCPSGWHLPSHAEWEQLVDYLGGENIAGGKLKETGTTHWKTPNTGATNESGFTAVPGGDANLGWGLSGVGYSSIWWSSSWNNLNPTDYFPSIEYNSNLVHWGKYNGCCNVQDYKSFGLSVRCVKD